MTYRIGSLFSGAGGLDMAVEQVFGGTTVWHSEIDKAASTVLAHRWPDVPNLGSITEIDWAAVEPVDVLCGGFPCQDVSAAGKRAGIKDGTRSGLWAVFADAIDALRPRYVVIENVRGLLSATAHRNLESGDAVVGDAAGRPVLRAAGAVLGDLADLRYDAQWTTLAAADVGAPHRRERVFIVGTASHPRHNAGCAEQGIKHEKQASWVRESSHRASGDEPGVALLPTPCVVDRLATGEMTLEEWDESRRSQKERGVGSFGPRGDSLGAAILRVEEGSERPDYSTTKARRGGDEPGVALLPTPTAQCAKHGAESRFGGGNGDVSNLWQIAHLLPTPVSRDGKDTYSSQGMAEKSKLTGIAHLLPTPASADGQRGQDFARANREGSGGDDLVTLAVKADRDSAWGKYAPAIHRWGSLTRPAPAPTEPNKNGNPRLSAAFSEWLMGWPAGWVTDPDIGISRNDQLRIIGNGVCPQQATAALTLLLQVAQVAA